VAEQAIRITLFGTSACHLCELAAAMLHQASATFPGLAIIETDISESDVLFERYGLLIPVIQDSHGNELGWPFTDEELCSFLQQQ
jgi:hypothetical protein